MSILRKAVLGLALTVSVSGAAMADDPILNFGGNPAAISFTAIGNGGVLSANTTASTSFIAGIIPPSPNLATRFLFTSNMVNGSATSLFGNIFAQFGPGSFSFINDDVSDANYNNVILSGSFLGGILQVSTFGLNQSIGFNTASVSYDGTGYAEPAFNAFYSYPNYPLQGTLGLTSTAVNPTTSITGGNGLASFGAQVSGNLSASSAVPEPGEWAAMGILASGLTGLMVRSRRRRA